MNIRRSQAPSVPAHLARFDPEQWHADFSAASELWRDARLDWVIAHPQVSLDDFLLAGIDAHQQAILSERHTAA